MKRKIIFKKDGRITSEGELDVRAGEYIVDGEVGSGGTADFNAKEGEPGYIANKPLSKTVTTETNTYGSGNTYVDMNNAKLKPGEDVFGYVYAADGGTLEGSDEDYTLKKNELYFMRRAKSIEFPKPVEEVVDTGYIGVSSLHMRVVFALIESWLTEDQQSGGYNYVSVYDSRVFFKPDEEIKTASDFDYAAFDIIGLDPEDPSLNSEIIMQAIEAHESELIALCDKYFYKAAGGIFVITPYAWSEQEQTGVSKAYIAGPSDTYMNYWSISSGHKVVENYAMLQDNTFSYVIITPVINEVYSKYSPEQEDAFYDKAAETTLSDYGMSLIVEVTTTTTEYQQLEDAYLPDSTRIILNTPRIVGKVPADANSMGKDLPIVEYTGLTQITMYNNTLTIYPPQELMAILNQAVMGGTEISGGAYAIIEVLNVMVAAPTLGVTPDKFTWLPAYYKENKTGIQGTYFTVTTDSGQNGTKYNVFYTIRAYPFGGFSDGMA